MLWQEFDHLWLVEATRRIEKLLCLRWNVARVKASNLFYSWHGSSLHFSC